MAKIIKGSVEVLIITLFLFIFCGCSGKVKVDFAKYITAEYDGFNGYSGVEFSFDEEKFLEDNKKKIEDESVYENFIDSIEYYYEDENNYSNGDIITVRVTCNESLLEGLNIKVKSTEFRYKVSGLQEGTVIDVFADVDVEVYGISPQAEALVTNNSDNEYVQTLKFRFDNNADTISGVKSGDTLNVICNIDKEEATKNGYIVLENERTFTVGVLDAYVDKAEDIDVEETFNNSIVKEDVEVIHTQTEDMQFRMLYKASGNTNYLFQYNKEWVENVEFYDAKLLVKKEASMEEPYNYIYVIYKAYVTNADYGEEVYFFFEYSNAVTAADGTFMLAHNDEELRYSCDTDYEELYQLKIASKSEKYDISDVSGIEIRE